MNCSRTILLLVLASAIWLGAPAVPAEAKNIGDSLMVITTDENGVPIPGACDDQTNSVCRVESQWEYETVAASQTDQIFGTTGAAGDLVNAVKCVTSAASAGAVTIKDGTGSAITLFNAQLAANDALNKDNLNWVSTDGGWKLTTGTNTTCIISGRAN